tara:strand:- start:5 stop:478 length:474 start_codon:yes stop_codon:yes gene_type:complete
MNNIDYKDQFYGLVDYLEKFYFVKVKQQPYAEDAWYFNLNLITINSNLKFRERFFTLLHESGHVILDSDIKTKKSSICFNKNVPDNVRSKSAYVHNINEEILAWNYGKSLVNTLNYKYEEEKLEEYMTDCIMSYIKSGLNSVYGKEVNVSAIRIKYV